MSDDIKMYRLFPHLNGEFKIIQHQFSVSNEEDFENFMILTEMAGTTILRSYAVPMHDFFFYDPLFKHYVINKN